MALVIRESVGYMVDQLRGNSGFSRDQAAIIVDYLWDLSEDDGVDMDFDTAEIRGEWNAENVSDLRELYSNISEFEEAEDDDELLEALSDRTLIAGQVGDSVVFRVF